MLYRDRRRQEPAPGRAHRQGDRKERGARPFNGSALAGLKRTSAAGAKRALKRTPRPDVTPRADSAGLRLIPRRPNGNTVVVIATRTLSKVAPSTSARSRLSTTKMP